MVSFVPNELPKLEGTEILLAAGGEIRLFRPVRLHDSISSLSVLELRCPSTGNVVAMGLDKMTSTPRGRGYDDCTLSHSCGTYRARPRSVSKTIRISPFVCDGGI